MFTCHQYTKELSATAATTFSGDLTSRIPHDLSTMVLSTEELSAAAATTFSGDLTSRIPHDLSNDGDKGSFRSSVISFLPMLQSAVGRQYSDVLAAANIFDDIIELPSFP